MTVEARIAGYRDKAVTRESSSRGAAERNLSLVSEGLCQRQGALGELIVCADLLARGYNVYRNAAVYGPDLVAERDGRCCLIEVKAARPSRRDGKLRVQAQPGRFDVLAAVLLNGTIDVTYHPDISEWFNG